MTILALEFSSMQRSVAVLEGLDLRLRSVVTEASQRGINGMSLIDRALTQAEATPDEIKIVALGLGPWSYAGIRSAIAIAQGWELGLGTKLAGINSVEVLALEAQTRGMLGLVTIVIDAQRSQLYQASVEISASEIRVVEPLKISPIEALDDTRTVIGPGASQLLRGGIDLFPGAHALGRLAARQVNFLPGEKLEPIYLRETTFVKATPPRLVSPAQTGIRKK